MPKTKDLKNKIMEKIEKNEIKMKPRWYFVLGGVLTFIGFLSATIFSILSVNLIFFLLRKHYGPMYQYRLQLILANFPWWLVIISILGIFFGIKLLKEYRFSYKNNLFLIFGVYILIIFLSAFLIDKFNLNNFFYQRGFFKNKNFYNQDLKKHPFKMKKYRFFDVR